MKRQKLLKSRPVDGSVATMCDDHVGPSDVGAAREVEDQERNASRPSRRDSTIDRLSAGRRGCEHAEHAGRDHHAEPSDQTLTQEVPA